jgi:alpha-L-rhamnosidase
LSTPPSHLTVNGLSAPLDLDTTPRFGWHVNTDEQTAYEIRVSSTSAKADTATGDVWTTGKILSRGQTGIPYTGSLLAPSTRFFWTVRLWDSEDRVSDWSSAATFGTGPGSSWSNSQPIWAVVDSSSWTDYSVTAHLTISEVALGIRFRAADTNNGYMWQFRGTDNRLVPHRLQNGTFTVIETVTLPTNTLAVGKNVLVRIETVGSTFRTYVDGVLVHTLTDTTFASGGVGVRTGATESGSLADLAVTASNGQSLLVTDFPTGDRTFGCGSVSGGAFVVPKSTHCLTRGFSVDWAFLRKSFTLADKAIAWATAYATATSPLPARQYVYKLYLNGTFVGLGPTQSTSTEARYDGFDVTSLLKAGQLNALGVQAYATKGQSFQAEVVVQYADGMRETIGTDGTWKSRTGESTYPAVGSIGTSYYVAPKENLSATEFPYGFDAPAFADGAWSPAGVKAPIGTLAAAPMAKVREQLKLPVQIVQTGANNYFIDFGRTWVGGVEYQINNGTMGETVELRFGEVTSAANTVRYQLNTGNTYQDVYTLTGGSQVFRTWGMRVFRYVEILGAKEPITTSNLKALALVYPFDASSSTFDASDESLKQVWQLSKNTIEAANVNFYTDSWTRERADYEADAYLQQRSNLYLSDDPTLGRYSIDYFETNRTWPTEWPLYVILAVHDAWQKTGDTQQIVDRYATLVNKLPTTWFETATNLIRKTTGSNGCSSTTDCDIVDWPTSQRDGFVFQEYNTVLNALSYRAYRDMSEMAAAIGRTADANTYASRAASLRVAINARLYSSVNGRYDDGMGSTGTLTGHYSLHASAFALAFGVPETAEVSRVAAYVASKGMACSVYGAAFLTDALFDSQSANAALALLTSTGTSSWLNMIQDGAGATAEAWDVSQKSNLTYSHPWAASPAFLIPSGLFGIRPLEPGYARFRVEPRPGTLEYATVTIPTVRGKIGAAFNNSSTDVFQLAVQIPGNTAATVRIPAKSATTTLYVDGVAQLATSDNGYTEIQTLGHGCHLVSEVPMTLSLADARLAGICASKILP